MRALPPLFCAILLAGCEKELPLPGASEPGKIVLIGELIAEDSFSIRAGKSAPIAMGSTVSAPDGLMLTVTDNEGATFTAAGVRDEFSAELHTVALSVPLKVQSGKHYSLSAKQEGTSEASVSAFIPHSFNATITDTASDTRAGLPVLRFSIRIDDAPGDSYYVIEAVKQPMNVRREFFYKGSWREVRYYRYQYDSLKASGVSFAERADTTLGKTFQRLNVYTTDALTENLQAGSSIQNGYRRVLLTDRTFAGSSYTTDVEVDRRFFVGAAPEERGRVLFQIKSVQKEYFEFLKSYERQAPSAGGDVSSLKGNVAGGFGAVGGVVKREWPYVFDEWE